MVARKPTVPHPNAPPPPPPGFGLSQSHHDIDTGDVPPISTLRTREEDSPYKDMGNPWVEVTSPVASRQPERHSNLGPANTTDTSEVPDILKPGWSGENTPRSSLDSQESRDFWESSDDDDNAGDSNKDKHKGKGKGKGKAKKIFQAQPETESNSTDDLVIPSPLQIRRKPVAATPLPDLNPTFEPPVPKAGFASNNPFRKSPATTPDPPIDLLPSWGSEVGSKSREDDSSLTAHLQGLSLDNPSEQQYTTYRPNQFQVAPNSQQHDQTPPPPRAPPPPAPAHRPLSPFSEQPPLIPVSPKADDHINPWSSQQNISGNPSPIPFAPSQKQNTYSTESLLDRGPKAGGRIALGDELKVLPNAAQGSTSQTSLLDDDIHPSQPRRPGISGVDEEFAPPPGPPPSHRARTKYSSSPPPPTKPPRPAVVNKPLSDVEIAQMQEQRNETYQIKHFNWFDHRSGNVRMSSMLTQNKNGPCPLLALVNALILGAKDESQAALDNALKSREQVSLGLIIETLMDELLSSGSHLDGDLPDVDELNKFLMKLRTGMNMNPRFVQPTAPAPNLMDARNSILHMPTATAHDQSGNFEMTPDVRLYSSFGIKTVHGWLPEPGSEAVDAFARSAQNYEDAQVVQFGEEELDYKLTTGGLSQREQQLWGDIISIKNFFNQYPTQLTPYGLSAIRQSMQPGSFAILFRNDHFSTIYKHPSDGKLYTLITDAGYADRDEVIWESLVDISGQQSEFCSGDFHSVSHHLSDSDRRRSSLLSAEAAVPEPLSPQQQQEQHDADFAMALHLQEEEEQRMRQQRNRSTSTSGSGVASTAASTGTGRGAGNARRGQGIPIQLRNSNAGTDNRPLIPPRSQRAGPPAVNRPSDALDADAPPTYEEAARGTPYNPPLGSPLHPQSSASAEPSPYASVSNVALPETVAVDSNEVPALRRPQRRQSAYSENHDRLGPSSPRASSGRFEMGTSPAYSDSNSRIPGSYVYTGRPGMSNTGSSTRRRDDNECIVM